MCTVGLGINPLGRFLQKQGLPSGEPFDDIQSLMNNGNFGGPNQKASSPAAVVASPGPFTVQPAAQVVRPRRMSSKVGVGRPFTVSEL